MPVNKRTTAPSPWPEVIASLVAALEGSTDGSCTVELGLEEDRSGDDSGFVKHRRTGWTTYTIRCYSPLHDDRRQEH